MGKNDFDIDFDFEEEDNFDPKTFLGTEEYNDDIDLNRIVGTSDMKKIKDLSIETFKTLNLSGVCRIDYLIDSQNNKIYVSI